MRISAIATTLTLSCVLAAISVVLSGALEQSGRHSLQKAMREAMPPKADCTVTPAGRAGCTFKTAVVKYTLFDAPESIQGDIYYKDTGAAQAALGERQAVRTVRSEETKGLEKLMAGFFTKFGRQLSLFGQDWLSRIFVLYLFGCSKGIIL